MHSLPVQDDFRPVETKTAWKVRPHHSPEYQPSIAPRSVSLKKVVNRSPEFSIRIRSQEGDKDAVSLSLRVRFVCDSGSLLVIGCCDISQVHEELPIDQADILTRGSRGAKGRCHSRDIQPRRVKDGLAD